MIHYWQADITDAILSDFILKLESSSQFAVAWNSDVIFWSLHHVWYKPLTAEDHRM